jgi:hypothetical protein
MSLLVALALARVAGSTQGSTLCAGVESAIEPDMQIQESDLDRAAASAAAGKLQDMIRRGELDGEFHLGAMNQLKIVRGHILLHHAQSSRTAFGPASAEAKDSTMALCNWLTTEGFWHD